MQLCKDENKRNFEVSSSCNFCKDEYKKGFESREDEIKEARMKQK